MIRRWRREKERKERGGGDINKRGKYVIFSSFSAFNRGYYTLRRRDTFNRCVCSRFVISMDDLYFEKGLPIDVNNRVITI